MFRDVFKAELDYLFQLCEELGQSQPALAPMLGRGADPAMSRLVEGLAFSFGRVQQRLDDELPEIIHPIIDNLCPELLRPIPSGTVIELVPTAKMMSRSVVHAGSVFSSTASGGPACHFRSTIDCEVSPLSVRGVEISSPSQERRSLKVALEAISGVELSAIVPRALRLFLAHPLAMGLEARAFLLRHTVDVVVRSSETSGAVSLGRPRSGPTALASEARTDLPIARALLGLRDYFTFPQSFAFIEVPDFEKVAGLGEAIRLLEIEFVFDRPVPKGIVFDRNTVVLHAVPALNVFRVPTLTVPLSADKRRCHVRFGPELEGAEVHRIEQVALVSRGMRGVPIEPWARFFPPRIGEADGGLRYELHRTPSVVGPQLDIGIAFTAEGTHGIALDTSDVEIDLFATNGERAATLGVGDVCVRTTGSPSLVTFRNITPITRSAPAMVRGDSLWQAYRLLKATIASLADTETLAAALALANVPARANWPEAKPSAESFVALVRAEWQRSRAPVLDEVQSGASVRLQLDARRFTGPGDIALFGELVVPLLAATVRAQQWVEVVLVDAAGAPIAEYPRTQGTRLGL